MITASRHSGDCRPGFMYVCHKIILCSSFTRCNMKDRRNFVCFARHNDFRRIYLARDFARSSLAPSEREVSYASSARAVCTVASVNFYSFHGEKKKPHTAHTHHYARWTQSRLHAHAYLHSRQREKRQTRTGDWSAVCTCACTAGGQEDGGGGGGG